MTDAEPDKKRTSVSKRKSFYKPIKRQILNKLKNIHQDRKSEDEEQPDGVNDPFHRAVDRLFTDPFDQAEQRAGTIQRGDRKEIEHREVHADKRRDLEGVTKPVAHDLRGLHDRCDRSADGVQPEFAR